MGEVISLSDEQFEQMVADGELFQCAKCGEWHHAEESMMVDDEEWCAVCVRVASHGGEVWKCHECDSWHTYAEEEPADVEGNLVCEDCRVSGDYVCCERCGKWVRAEHSVEVHGYRTDEYWCERCAEDYAHRCENCGSYFMNSDDVEYVHCRDEYWCRECLDVNDNIHRCDVCGEWRYDDDMHWSNSRDAWVCDDCDDEKVKEYHALRDRGYEKRRCEGEGSDVPCFGFELETEEGDVDDRVEVTEEICGDDISMEHDGSLNSDGIENVSQPMTERYFAEVFPLERWTAALIDAGARSHDAQHCGLHVHVGREVAGDTAEERYLTAGRVRSFLYRYMRVVKKFARRSGEEWCHYDCDNSEYNTADDYGRDDVMRNLGSRCNSRYRALNTDHIDDYIRTIEYRIFKGTLNAATIRASVEFCLKLTRFCRAVDGADCTWENFRAWGEESAALKERLDKAEVKAGMRPAEPVEESAEVVNQ